MSDNCLEFTVHNRYPDYTRPLRNADWERPTLREVAPGLSTACHFAAPLPITRQRALA